MKERNMEMNKNNLNTELVFKGGDGVKVSTLRVFEAFA